jgi:amino acid transporter
MKAIGLALGVGAIFYAVSIAAVAYIAPWQSLLGRRFATAIAFEQGIGARWPVELILFMAFFGLLQCFNGNFAASTRLLFAYGRRRTIHESFGTVHQKFLTPSVAVVGITAGTLVGIFLGDALLVPVTEVGSMASALGWFAACLSFWIVEKRVSMRIVSGMGIAVSLLLFLMKVLPAFPGHFSPAEWTAFGIWVALGLVLRAWR